MLANSLEWLLLVQMRDVAIAIMVGILELGEAVVMGRPLHSHVVNLDFFVGLKVVVNNHSLTSDNGHLTHFARLQPAALDGSETFMAEEKGHVGDVLDLRSNVRVTPQVEEDRKSTRLDSRHIPL